MAQRTAVVLVDDLSGHQATDENPVSTVPFGLDGVSYEIDLDVDNELALREILERHAAKARRTGRASSRASRRTVSPAASRSTDTPSSAERAENRRIRDWAESQGITLAERGRIPDEVKVAYRAGGGG